MTRLAIALFVVLSVSCADARQRAGAGTAAFIDCEAAALTATLAELVPLARAAVMTAIRGDGTISADALWRAAAPLKSDLGRCALATAIAIMSAPPAAPSAERAIASAASSPPIDGAALRSSFVAMRTELGWRPVRTSGGVL